MNKPKQNVENKDIFICEKCGYDGHQHPRRPVMTNEIRLDTGERLNLCFVCSSDYCPPAYPLTPSGVKKVYLAGKVTGLDAAEASQRFGMHEMKLKRQGHHVVVPLNLVPHTCTWAEAMKICIPAMLECDKVFFMPCWKDSKGATMEHDIATRLNMDIEYL